MIKYEFFFAIVFKVSPCRGHARGDAFKEFKKMAAMASSGAGAVVERIFAVPGSGHAFAIGNRSGGYELKKLPEVADEDAIVPAVSGCGGFGLGGKKGG